MKEKLTAKKETKYRYLALSFVLPVLCFLATYAIFKVKPFGPNYMLYLDSAGQYYPFFKNFKDALVSGESLLWNWNVGMGVDYLGIISYYLASPLNLLLVVIPEAWIPGYYHLLLPLKLGLASLFFAIMLKCFYGKNDITLSLFSSFYGLCAWVLGYHWNIMWLDSFALLPLVVLGTIKLLRDKEYSLYTISLFFCVLANYYVGFFVCIFVFLLFFCYEFCRPAGARRFFADLGRIALFTTIALGATTFLTLPGLAALQNTHSSIDTFPDSLALNIASGDLVKNAKEALSKFRTSKENGDATFAMWVETAKATFLVVNDLAQKLSGSLGCGAAITFKDGLPNIHTGTFVIPFCFLFLTNPNIYKKDKWCGALLLTFFGLSFSLLQLDYIWHGFHYPNALPYRFSFLFSFVSLIMAYQAWTQRKYYSTKQIQIAALLAICVVLLGGSENADNLSWNILQTVLYCLLMAYYCFAHRRQKSQELTKQAEKEETTNDGECDTQKKAKPFVIHAPSYQTQKSLASAGICFMLCIEIVVNMANFIIAYPTALRNNYPWDENGVSQALKEIEKDKNDLFFRSELAHTFAINDGSLYGYHGISAFTSSANAKVTKFLVKLGVSADLPHNQYRYDETSPVTNLFLNLKYLYSTSNYHPENPYFAEMGTWNGVTLLENRAYLPIGFLANSPLADERLLQVERGFPFQNEIFKAATGYNTDVWRIIPTENMNVTYDEQLDLLKQKGGHYLYTKNGQNGTVTYAFNAMEEGLLCIDITLPYMGIGFNVYKVITTESGSQDVLLYDEQYFFPQVLSVCEVQPGDRIKIVINFAEGEQEGASSGDMIVNAAIADAETFQIGYDILKECTLELSEFRNNYVAGTIDCNREGILYTSIPQDGNWEVYLDGKQVLEPVLVGNVMLSVRVSEGSHTVEFRYRNKTFELGAGLSCICITTFAVFLIVDKKRKKG